MEIRKAVPADLAQIMEIATASFPDPWSAVLFQQALEQQETPFYCAAEGEHLLGYLVLSFCGDVINLDDIAVASTARCQGIAHQLLGQAFRDYPDRTFWLEVRQSNTAAIALYQAHGFIQTGLRRRYYQNPTEDAVLMTKI